MRRAFDIFLALLTYGLLAHLFRRYREARQFEYEVRLAGRQLSERLKELKESK